MELRATSQKQKIDFLDFSFINDRFANVLNLHLDL